MSIVYSYRRISRVVVVELLLNQKRVSESSSFIGQNLKVVERSHSSKVPPINHLVECDCCVDASRQSSRWAVYDPVLSSNHKAVPAVRWQARRRQSVVIDWVLDEYYVSIKNRLRKLNRE